MKMRQRWALGFAALAAGVPLAGCGQAGQTHYAGTAGMAGGTSGGAPMAITLKALDTMKFDPALITVRQGQRVVLTIANQGSLAHDFAVRKMPVTGVKEPKEGGGHAMGGMKESDLALHAATSGRQSVTLEFTPTEKGTYEFVCTTPGHEEAGMKGKLVVE